MPNLPPPGVTPIDLWLQFSSLTRASCLVELPRKGPDGRPIGQVAMVVLTQEESIAADLSTERWVRKLLKDASSLPSNGEPCAGYNALYEKRASLEILFRCCKKADALDRPFFPGAEAIAAKCTTDEIGILMWNYLRAQSELGQITAAMTSAEMDVWIERLVEGGSAFPFDSLSLGLQSQLLMYMASRCAASAKGSSSPGAPPEATI